MNKITLAVIVASLCILQCNAAASSSHTVNQKSLNKALYKAIKEEDTSAATQALNVGADPKAKYGCLKKPFLRCAVKTGNPDMVALLLERGAAKDGCYDDYYGQTALNLAVQILPRKPKASTIIAMLFKAGILIDRKSENLYCIAQNTHNQNRDLFPIIAELITAGESNTRRRFYIPTPSEVTGSPARKEFIEAYPGTTPEEKNILSIVLHMCSDDEATHSEAKKQARVLLKDPNRAHKISCFLPLSERGGPAYEGVSDLYCPEFTGLHFYASAPRAYDKSICPSEFLLDEPNSFNLTK